MKQVTSMSSSLMHERGHPKPVLWDSLEGSGEREVGGWVQDGGHMYTYGQFMVIYVRSHHDTVK